MANQSPDRRAVLEILAKAAAASQFPGFVRWSFAQQHDHTAPAPPPRTGVYQPAYFTAGEFHTLDILTELIIPAGESPGAHDAGVAEFIDFMAAHLEDGARAPIRDGLRWLNGAVHEKYGADFAALTHDQQVEFLNGIAPQSGNKPGVPAKRGHAFFRLIRRYTVMGYYTSRTGLEELDYPGLRLYTESPACPHTNDPEHRHLPPPRV